ncbi:MAG: decarboxylating 6-phosphogluconate dehydrogenase [Chloroflexi bacterium]|nr:decarboxylating 6-phosphogluconate dehydrogenase [Chloroflexota bacterium]
MKMGIVGLGRMGAGIRSRLELDGHEVVGYDRNPEVSDAASLAEMVDRLDAPRIVWVMVPSGEITDATLGEVGALLENDDILIDGGNSYYRDSLRHAEEAAELGVRFMDVGTSGGIWGLEIGFNLMIGGSPETFAVVEPLFKSLAPENGYALVGPVGAGHFTKMVHNGIEYGMLQAYAEGFELLNAYDEKLDLHQIASLWQNGSVVRSWLLELGESAFEKDPELAGLRGYVDDSGEGRWTILEAVERGVPLGVISQSVYSRFSSRDDNAFGMRVIAALRNEFGGHATKSS